MNVAVLGTWHLGSVTAACAAAAGIPTVGIDHDAERIAGLTRGEAPLYEPGLAELVSAGVRSGKLRFTTDVTAVAGADVVWVCYDTPVDDEDRADVDEVRRRVEAVFPYLNDGAVVLVSSQMPVGSVAALERAFTERHAGRRVSFACSPENLRLGRAIEAFRKADRIIVGVRDERTRMVLDPLLRTFCGNLIWMSVESAEMVKHAINAFLALSITFTNEIAAICERVGADAAEVEAGLRSEPRIGKSAYVKAGPAFAGGTLARDVNFLDELARANEVAAPVIGNVLASNRNHGQWAFSHLRRAWQPMSGGTVAVLGLAYKPGTSTLRRSAAIELIRMLVKQGVIVRAFDPQVPSLPDDLAGAVTLAANAREAATGADAMIVATEWPEFRTLSPDDIAGAMKGDMILDAGRFLGETFAAHPRLTVVSVGRAT